MVKGVFPHLGDVVDPELAKLFREVKADGWYSADLYLRAREYLIKHMSPTVNALVGTRLIDLFESQLRELGINTPRNFMEKVNDVYREFVRGEGGGWTLEEYREGRSILRYDGDFAQPDICVGIVRRALESTGAYNIRVEMIDTRSGEGGADRYLMEWIMA
ncbi:MAG: hypothetical protein PVH29_03160 [Candidatus Zixiibacteriota bacterium]